MIKYIKRLFNIKDDSKLIDVEMLKEHERLAQLENTDIKVDGQFRIKGADLVSAVREELRRERRRGWKGEL